MQQTEETQKGLSKLVQRIAVALLVVFVLNEIRMMLLYRGTSGLFFIRSFYPIFGWGAFFYNGILELKGILVFLSDLIEILFPFAILTIIYFVLMKRKKAPDWVVLFATFGSLVELLFELYYKFVQGYYYYDYYIFNLKIIFYVLYLVILIVYMRASGFSFVKKQQQIYRPLPVDKEPAADGAGADQVQVYLMMNQAKFNQEDLYHLQTVLPQLPAAAFQQLQLLSLKDPNIVWIISFLAGNIGVDRFMLGDIVLGILKLVTFGCFGVWTIIDLFLVRKRARQINFEQVMKIVQIYVQ